MVHGEAWGNNFIWCRSTFEVYMLDFDQIGFYNPTIDLVFYMMHLPFARRRKFEKPFLKAYHDRLMEFPRVPKTYTMDRLMLDMVKYGFPRVFTWFSILQTVGGTRLSNDGADKISTFMDDHKIKSRDVGMPAYGFL